MAMYKKYRLNISWESQFSRFSNGRRSWRSNWSDKCNAPSEALVIIIIIITKNKVAGLNWGGGWLKSSYPFKNKINAYRSKWERGLLKKKGKAKKKKKRQLFYPVWRAESLLLGCHLHYYSPIGTQRSSTHRRSPLPSPSAKIYTVTAPKLSAETSAPEIATGD